MYSVKFICNKFKCYLIIIDFKRVHSSCLTLTASHNVGYQRYGISRRSTTQVTHISRSTQRNRYDRREVGHHAHVKDDSLVGGAVTLPPRSASFLRYPHQPGWAECVPAGRTDCGAGGGACRIPLVSLCMVIS